MNPIIEKARELGMMLAESDEMKALKGGEELQLADPDAQVLMMEYANKRDEIAKKAQKPDITKEEFERIMSGEQLFGGVCGDADKAVEAFLNGNLNFNPNAKCNHHGHHHGEGHSCGNNCSNHGCH